MTTIAITTDQYGLRNLKANGRLVTVDGRIADIRNVGAGRWEGETSLGDTFTLIGGRASGGASNEWFVKYETGYGDSYVPADSAVKALNLIENI